MSVCVCVSGIVIKMLTSMGFQILSSGIDMISEMRSCLLFGITEDAAAKAVELAAKCNMISLNGGLGILY